MRKESKHLAATFAKKKSSAKHKHSKPMYNIDVESLLWLPGKVHVYWKDLSLNYLGSNDQMAEVNKFPTRAEISGQSDFDLKWPNQADQFQSHDREVITSGIAKQFYNFSTLPDREITYHTIKFPLKNQNGKTVGIFGISHYLTERFIHKNLNRMRDAGIPVNYNSFSNFDKVILEMQCSKYKLSKRQTECLYYLVRGMTLKQIGKVLNLSPRTVECYIELIKDKMDCHSKLDLINKCMEMGLTNFSF